MRFLVSLSNFEQRIGPVVITAMQGKFEILEGQPGVTPLDLQFSHVTQSTAESLVAKYPGEWQIVDSRELEELERLYSS